MAQLQFFFVTSIPTLTYKDSLQEQANHYFEIQEKITLDHERIGFLELQVGFLQEELAKLKKENRRLKEQLIDFPSLIESHIQDTLSNL